VFLFLKEKEGNYLRCHYAEWARKLNSSLKFSPAAGVLKFSWAGAIKNMLEYFKKSCHNPLGSKVPNNWS